MKRGLLQALAGLSGITLILDTLERGADVEAWDKFPGFDFLVGLTGTALLVLLSKALTRLAGRDEKYYD